MNQREFPCQQCGAKVSYQPGQTALVCPYCKHSNPVPELEEAVEEIDYAATLSTLAQAQDVLVAATVRCGGCGAEYTRPPGVSADLCPYCGVAVVSQSGSTRLIKPRSLLPFHVTREQARASFRRWLHGLWFAPSSLRKFADADDRLKGMYMPFWTYDCRTVTRYTGQRGEDYWTTETYTVYVNGKHETRTRQVRKTRWWPASGTVDNAFDDVLVAASPSLPEKYVRRLEPWDLPQLVPYQDDYLAGFTAESYQIELPQGFEVARQLMEPAIHSTICRDIGGDHQRVSSTDTRYFNITFKHILLPVWLSAYRHHGRVYRFMINARTGEVQGERPWSTAKIVLLVLAILAAAIAVMLLISGAMSGAGQGFRLPAEAMPFRGF